MAPVPPIDVYPVPPGTSHGTQARPGSPAWLVQDAIAHLFTARNTAGYTATGAAGRQCGGHQTGADTRPFTGVRPAELSRRVAAVDLDPAGGHGRGPDELESVYLRDAVYFHDTKYAAHLNCPVVIPALVGEAVLSAVNSSMDTWDQSAGATMIERRLIDWTAERLGLGPAADGVFTSGGTQSNLQALLIARNHAVACLRLDPERRAAPAGPVGAATDLHLRRQPLQHPQVCVHAGPGI